MKTNTMTDEELIKAWTTSEKDGHAPMSNMTMPAAYFIYPPGHPKLIEAQRRYDEHYFKRHPEKREEYGYKGP
jgi:hypothetical protein